MTYRKLVIGDIVKIIGPWNETTLYHSIVIGDTVEVSQISTDTQMPYLLSNGYLWCRKNLRALPRKKSG